MPRNLPSLAELSIDVESSEVLTSARDKRQGFCTEDSMRGRAGRSRTLCINIESDIH